jgi:hypothetical protein
MKHLARLAELRGQKMAIKIKGIELNKDVSFTIKEQHIKNTVVNMPNKYYQAKAALETCWGSVEITGSTLHNIVQQVLVQNKEFRSTIKMFLDELDNGHEDLYSAKKY